MVDLELAEGTLTAIHEMTATALLQAYRTGALTRREVVEAQLARIDAVNPGVNAVIDRFDERALAEAAAADRAPASERAGLALDGVPVVVSDWYAVEGSPQTLGVKAFAGVVSDADDAVVDRIRAAGAIILGKAAIPEMALRWNVVSELYGETRNPRDLGCSAGGSGGGVAAAVASGMAPIGFHADAGGSLRVPAGFCGIVALRPTPNAVIPLVAPSVLSMPLEGATALGPHARSVEDAWLAVQAVAGAHPSVPLTPPSRLPASFRSDERPPVAVMVDQAGALVDDDVRAEVRRTAEALAAAGHDVVEAAPPDAPRLAELWLRLLGTEVVHSFLPPVREQVGASAVQHMDELFTLGDVGNDVARFIAVMTELRTAQRALSEWMQDRPLILAPIAGMRRPPIDYDLWLSGEQTRELFDRMRNVVLVNSMGLPAVALANGVQIIGRPHHDEQAVQAADAAMAALGPVAVAEPGVPA
jgi:amidase